MNWKRTPAGLTSEDGRFWITFRPYAHPEVSVALIAHLGWGQTPATMLFATVTEALAEAERRKEN